jgi:hypothetical protein
MERKTIAIAMLITLIGAGSVVGIGSLPVSASNGKQQIVCTASLTVSGTYNDYIVSHSISNFALTGGGTGCHARTLLDLFPSSQFNLFPTSLIFSVRLTAPDGTTHGPYLVRVSVPPGSAAPSYSFTEQIQIANVPQGQFAALVSCPVQCNSGSSYSTTIDI